MTSFHILCNTSVPHLALNEVPNLNDVVVLTNDEAFIVKELHYEPFYPKNKQIILQGIFKRI